MTHRQVSAILLAGGSSKRFGSNKLLLPLGGYPMIEHPIQRFRSAGVTDIIVVTGAYDEALQNAGLSSVRFIRNDQYESGMSSSVRVGIKALPTDSEAVFITPADLPLFSVQTVQALLRSMGHHSAIIPVHRGKKGHPVLISRKAATRCLSIVSEKALYDTLIEFKSATVFLDVEDEGTLMDIDLPEEYDRIRTRYDSLYPNGFQLATGNEKLKTEP